MSATIILIGQPTPTALHGRYEVPMECSCGWAEKCHVEQARITAKNHSETQHRNSAFALFDGKQYPL